MKKIILISLALIISSNICNAQLSAPVQSDTLYITSMQYNFNDISLENWPFTYIIQTTTSFIVDGKEFQIKDVKGQYSSGFHYSLLDGGNEYLLIKRQYSRNTVIEFSNYILNCSKRQNPNKSEQEFKPIAHQPSFHGGGPNEFAAWVSEHLNYPEIAKITGVQGRVTIEFTINKKGRVTNVSVLQGIDPSLNKEAIRVVSSSPKWTPGKDENGNPIEVSYTFPVIFQLR